MISVTPETSSPPRRRGKLPVQIFNEVSLLPEGMRAALRQLLVEGASLDYAAEAVNARHDWDFEPGPEAPARSRKIHPLVTVEAVRHFYQSDPQLQRERAQFFVSTTEAITLALSPSGEPQEGQSRYIKAVVIAGLAKVGDRDKSFALRDAVRQFNEMENLRLKHHLMRLKDQDLTRRGAFLEAQRNLAEEKKLFVRAQTDKTIRTLHKLVKKRHLTPETFQKIQETYGILAANVARIDLGPTLPQIDALAGPPPSDDDVEPENYMAADEAAIEKPKERLQPAEEQEAQPAEQEPAAQATEELNP